MSTFEGFPRAAHSIRQLLGLAQGDVSARLANAEVGISLAPQIQRGSSAFLAGELAVNLLARLYPRLAIDARDSVELIELALQVNPTIEVREGRANGPYFAVGETTESGDCVGSFGAKGWLLVLNDGSELGFNPFSAAVCACWGVGAIFRKVFSDVLPRPGFPQRPAVWSLRTQQARESSADLDGFKVRDVDALLVGVGAIGGACVWLLERAEIQGKLALIDPERIDVGNLQRYVLASSKDIGTAKTQLAASQLSQIVAEEISTSFDEVGLTIGDARLVLSALDSSVDRIALQALLPRSIVNAWTQQADLGVSIHRSFGETPCLACLYWPTRPRPNLHEQLGDILGINEGRALVYLLAQVPINAPLPVERLALLPEGLKSVDADIWTKRSLVDDLVARNVVTEEEISPWIGVTIDSFYREAVCGSALLSISTRLPEDEIPLAHQSALAGVMLALAATVPSDWKEARINVLQALPPHFKVNRRRTASCICSDPDYLARFREKWRS